MVVLSAAVCTKQGKLELARQFVEMTRSKTQTIWSSFSKLIDHDSKHCSFETPDCRFMYQHLDNHVVAIATNFSSNVMVDFDILTTLVRIVTDTLQGNRFEVSEIKFELVQKFDEVITPTGLFTYANLPDIQKAVEMDSHEARVAKMIKASQENEARVMAKKRAEQIRKLKKQQKDLEGPSNLKSALYQFGGVGGAITSQIPSATYESTTMPFNRGDSSKGHSLGGLGGKKQPSMGSMLGSGLDLSAATTNRQVFLQEDSNIQVLKIKQIIQFKTLSNPGNMKGVLQYNHKGNKKLYGFDICVKKNSKIKLNFKKKHIKHKSEGKDEFDFYRCMLDPKLLESKSEGLTTLLEWRGQKCVPAPGLEFDPEDGLGDDEIDLSLSSTGDFDDELKVSVSFTANTPAGSVTCEQDDEDVEIQTLTMADGKTEVTWVTVVDTSTTLKFPGAEAMNLFPFKLSWDIDPHVQVVHMVKNKKGDEIDIEEDLEIESRAQVLYAS